MLSDGRVCASIVVLSVKADIDSETGVWTMNGERQEPEGRGNNAEGEGDRGPGGREWANEDLARQFGIYKVSAQTHTGWHGRSGSTDRSVLLALVQLSERLAIYSPAFGTRALGDEAGCSASTVGRSLRRLADSGWITRKRSAPKSSGCAAIWELRIWDSPHLDPDATSGGASLSDDVRGFGGFALGGTAGRLFQRLPLSGDAVKLAEVAKDAGMSPATARRHASAMAEQELVVRKYGTVALCPDADLGTVERAYNVAGKRRKANAKHQQERKEFRAGSR